MTSIPLFYFSASGNTKYCAELVKCGIENDNISVKLRKISNVRNLPFPTENESLPAIGLAFPVYEFMVPRIILIWLHKLPPAKVSTPVFIIDTSGGLPCSAANVAIELLKKKNYVPFGVLEIPTPTIEPFFNNKYYPAGWSREILDRCYSFGKLIVLRLRREDDRFIGLQLGRYRFPKLTEYMYRYILRGSSSSAGMITLDDSKCNRCKACEKACPMAAIDLNNPEKPINDNRCMLCATCIRTCPTNAIKITYRPNAKPPSAKIAPKSRPGYISPQDYQAPTHPKLNIGYSKLLLNLIKSRRLK